PEAGERMRAVFSGAGCRPGSGSQHVSCKETNHERRKQVVRCIVDSTWLQAPFRTANSGGTGHEYDQEVLDRLTRVVRCRDSGERTCSRAAAPAASAAAAAAATAGATTTAAATSKAQHPLHHGR